MIVMNDQPGKNTSFWQELKRRRVIRIIPVYAAAAFVLLELADIIAEPFGLPEWTVKLVFVLLGIGLVVAIILAWIYDITPDGVVRTGAPEKTVSPAPESQWRTGTWKVVIYVSLAVIIGLLVWNIFGQKKRVNMLDGLERSIAVLPFENWSYQEEYSHLGNAMANEIITELYKVHEFRVLAHTSTLQYQDTKKSVTTIGEELGVNYIIEGIIERQNDDVNVHVQVIRTRNEDHIWADEFDGKWKDIFRILDDIAFKVADNLKAVLSENEREKIKQQPTVNHKAYDLYLRGRWFWNQWTPADIQKGMHYFRQAIESDPEYALALAGLAEAYNTLSFYGQMHPDSSYPKARDLALRALDIDPDLSEAHVALAFVKAYYDWDWDGGEQEFLKAISLDPANITAHHLYAYFLVLLARYEEALTEINKALDLDPLNLITNRTLGDFYYHRREYDKAKKQLIQTLEMDSRFNFTHAYLGLVYLQQSLCEKALNELQKEIDLGQGTGDVALAWKAYTYGKCGNKKMGIRILDTLHALAMERHIPPSYFSWIYFALDDHEKGFEWMEMAYNERDPWLTEIRNNHFYDGVRTDPRYQEILEKMQLGR
jgi:TolB-like protein/Tfp pilus assembly protein PilF